MTKPLMQFHPHNGEPIKLGVNRGVAAWRPNPNSNTFDHRWDVWQFNPWTGQARDSSDVDSDPYGLGIQLPGEEAIAAPTMPPPPKCLTVNPEFIAEMRKGIDKSAGTHHPVLGFVGDEPAHQMSAFVEPGYEPLFLALMEALEQAQHGKGHERHANGRPFVDQPIFQINRAIGSAHGAIYQVAKKAEESAKMTPEKACAELMGSIVYACASIILIREQAK